MPPTTKGLFRLQSYGKSILKGANFEPEVFLNF